MKNSGVKKYLKMIKPFDVIIVLALMVLSFLPYVFFAHSQSEQSAQQQSQQTVYTAVISHAGHTVHKIRLTGHKGVTKWRFTNGSDWNEIQATGQTVRITSADCNDQVCVRRGKISKPGQTIVCLPHKLLIEIKSSHGNSQNNTGGMVTE